mgnify:CR=1 FL=1
MDQATHEFFSENTKLFRSFGVLGEKVAGAISKLENDLVKWENQNISLEKQIKGKEATLAEIEVKIKERTAMAEMGAKQLMRRLDDQQRSVTEREAAVLYKEGLIKEQQEKVNKLLNAAEGKVAQLRGKSLQAA